jgi:hypothetical protein
MRIIHAAERHPHAEELIADDVLFHAAARAAADLHHGREVNGFTLRSSSLAVEQGQIKGFAP